MRRLLIIAIRRNGALWGGAVLMLGALGMDFDARAADAGRPAMGFEVEGELVTTMYSPQGEVRRATRHEFKVKVSGERWLIRTEDLDVRAGNKQSVERREISCDGRDVFELNMLPSSMATQATNRSTNRLYAFARGGTFPAKVLPSERVLWLAYCSSASFTAGSNLPSFRAPLDAAAQPLRCESELLPVSGLPLRYAQTAPGFLVFHDGKQPDRLDFPPPFNQGFVEYEYRATALTNLDQWVVPTAFEARFFAIAIKSATEGARYMPNQRRGTVTRVAAVTADEWRPQFGEAANVYDYRFTNGAGRLLTYVETNRTSWIERDDPKLRETVAAKAPMPVYGQIPRASGEKKWSRRASVITAVCLPTLLFAAWALFVRVKKTKQHREQANED
jgi:hypothetical protein